MNQSYKHDIGAYVAAKPAIAPQALAGSSAVEGPIYDRTGLGSCQIAVFTGETTGTPDAFSVAAKLQHGDEADGSDMADLDDAAITTITEEDAEARVNVDLAGAKRYVRAVVTPSFTGGAMPTAAVGATIVFGGADSLPLANVPLAEVPSGS